MFFSTFSFSAPAPGAYRQVPAPCAQRRGAEELHEYSGEGGTERWAPSIFFCEKSPSNFVSEFILRERTFFPHCSTHVGSSLVHFLQLILLYFAIVCEIENVREVGMKLCASSVCADKWGDKYLEKKSKYSALITQGKAATVTRLSCEPQCKLYSPFAKQ